MNLFIIGQAPSRSTDLLPPFSGSSRSRLDLLLREVALDFGLVVTYENVLKRFPGRSRSGKGDAFPIVRAKKEAEKLLFKLNSYDCVVVCGKLTASAFDLNVEYFEYRKLFGVPCIVIPHPSSVNRYWNLPYSMTKTQSEVYQFVQIVACESFHTM